MSIESLALLVGALVGALIIGYLAATLLARKKLSDAQTALQQAQSTAEQLTQKYTEVDSAHTNLQAKHRALELGNTTLIAQHEALTKNHAAIEQQNRLTNEKLATETAARHNAETEKQTAQTELAANKTAQESLQTRLNTTQSEVQAERQKLNEQIQRNADLDTQAKSAQVLAQENESKYKEQKTQREGLQEKYDAVQTKSTGLTSENAELKTAQAERDTSHKQQLEQHEQAHTTLLTKHKQAEDSLSAAIKERHAAQTENQAAQTELSENKKAQESLQARLSGAQSEVLSERTQLGQQLQRNAELDKQAKAEEVKAQETESKYKELKTQFDQTQSKLDILQEKYTTLLSDNTELKTAQNERDISHKQQLEQFDQQKIALSNEFNTIANKIFEEKSRSFTDTSKVSIDTMLQPFKAQIEGFQKRINDIHDASLKGNEGITNQIKSVLDIGLKMSKEATNLASALKGDSQQRGAWGEAQLERTLEMSGLVENAHYEKQSAFKDLEGKQKKTDYLIKLPDNKHMIIDSKVSLVAYDKAISAETPELHNLAMAAHVNAVKKHIDDLASKDYTNLVGMHSPSFVLMFMPIEPAYIDALKSSKDLFDYGYSKSIILVSHTTLIPILRTVANLWMMHRSNSEAREISDKAGDIYNQVCTVAERLQKLGNSLNTVKNHYNDTVTALVGQQGLHGKVERFNQLSNKVSKSMPAIEPQHIDFETERLLLAAEPIAEEPTGSTIAIIDNQPSYIEEAN